MNLQARVIGPQDKDLLNAAVNEVLYPNWPYVKPGPDVAREEEVTAGTILKGVNKKSPNIREFAIVLGENLDDPDKRHIAGISNGLYFPKSGTALMLYVHPAPEMRGNPAVEVQLMAQTFKAIKTLAKDSARPVKAVFIELLDPSAAETPEDRAGAERDRSYYAGALGAVDVGIMGGRQMPLDYANPHWDNDLRLYSFADNQGQYATPHDVRGLVDDLHKYWFEKSMKNKPSYSAMYDTMMGQIEDMEAKYDPALHIRKGGPAVDPTHG